MSGRVYNPVRVAESFRPHGFQTQQRLLKSVTEPKIFITPDAYADMLAIAQNAGSDEIGWLGTVSVINEGQYLIDGIYMPAQEVSPGRCVLTEDGLSEIGIQLAETDFEACERLLFWGHVHPGNSTVPSQQDEDQMDDLAYNEWFIRGIFGRRGRAEFTFFDYKNGVRWNDVPWAIYCPVDEARLERWRQEVEEKVSQITFHNPMSLGGGRTVNSIWGGEAW